MTKRRQCSFLAPSVLRHEFLRTKPAGAMFCSVTLTLSLRPSSLRTLLAVACLPVRAIAHTMYRVRKSSIPRLRELARWPEAARTQPRNRAFAEQGDPTGFLHPKWNYSICCLRDVVLKIERDLSNYIYSNSISLLEFSWTTLECVPCLDGLLLAFSMDPPSLLL